MPIDLSPVANERLVFFGGEAKNAIFAVSRKSGHSLWRFDIRHPSMIGISNGTLIVQASGKLVGIKASTGKQLWSSKLDIYMYALAGGRLFACTDFGIGIISVATGKLLGRIKGACKKQLAVDDSAIYYFTGKTFVARSINTWNVIWSREMKNVIGLAIAKNKIYVASKRTVYLFRKMSGHLIYSRRFEKGFIQTGPYLAPSCVLIVKNDNTLKCLGNSPGATK